MIKRTSRPAPLPKTLNKTQVPTCSVLVVKVKKSFSTPNAVTHRSTIICSVLNVVNTPMATLVMFVKELVMCEKIKLLVLLFVAIALAIMAHVFLSRSEKEQY